MAGAGWPAGAAPGRRSSGAASSPGRTRAPARGGGAGSSTQAELRVEVRPPWTFRLRGGSLDGLLRRRGPGLQRLLHRDGAPVHVAVVQLAPDKVLFAARAASEPDATWGIRRLRFATGVDDDLRPFHAAFRDDPLIGRAVRAHPALRVRRAVLPWEALVAAICEQLIEYERAVAIQRRLIAALGCRCPATGLRDAPGPDVVAAAAPARFVAMDLAPARALTLRRAAAEVASGRADLLAEDPLPAWRRLRAIPGIGRWTMEMLALNGHGRHDRVPAGDLGYLKIVGRLLTGRPTVRAEEDEVRELLARYGEWQGLAGEYLRLAAATGTLGAVEPVGSAGRRAHASRTVAAGAPVSPGARDRAPAPGGTRSSSPASPARAA